jgi:hypothetical protein
MIERFKPLNQGQCCLRVERVCAETLALNPIEFSNEKQVVLFCSCKLSNGATRIPVGNYPSSYLQERLFIF